MEQHESVVIGPVEEGFRTFSPGEITPLASLVGDLLRHLAERDARASIVDIDDSLAA